MARRTRSLCLRRREASDHVWSICTSHQAATRQLIPAICRALGVVAFDGQAGTLIVGGSD